MIDLLPNTLRTLRGAFLPSLPWAVLFFAAGALLLRAKKRRIPVFQLAALCLYAAMLLYGTVFSRVDSAADFFAPRLADTAPYFVWHFNPASGLSRLHFASNVLLFIPFGMTAMLFSGSKKHILPCTVMGAAASCLIELFQLSHGLRFDFGDLAANTLGTLLGCWLYLLLQRLAEKRERRS